MDPLLESSWSDAHTSLCTYTRDQLQAKLPHDLRARLEERIQLTLPEDQVTGETPPIRFIPDISVSESGRRNSGGTAVKEAPGQIGVAARSHIIFSDPVSKTRRVSIVDRIAGKLITTIEFLSPANKISEARRVQFRQKQRELLDAGVNLVEIDLIRAGGWAMTPAEEYLPLHLRNPYRIIVVRAELPDEAECYEVKLSEPLPTIAIPLRPTDQDITLEIQPLVSEAFEKAAYSTSDYERAPLPSYSAEENAWVMNRLTAAGIYRSPTDADQKAR
ncbi:hypothetical protein A6X21_16690 [Planctopirus hydrillae]|uniref:DUF4058 domain-containing protein n=2 Tax=Planctopirus hydrillae TaxID=1841610 RepID=A0A1C3EQF2_9PLAN|nr:hypothetical protein A6X21_16690 [Planctopirus hydrillae]